LIPAQSLGRAIAPTDLKSAGTELKSASRRDDISLLANAPAPYRSGSHPTAIGLRS